MKQKYSYYMNARDILFYAIIDCLVWWLSLVWGLGRDSFLLDTQGISTYAPQ